MKTCQKRQMILALIAHILILCFTLATTAQGEAEGKKVEIDGLIINQTQTRIGHEFYRQFVTFWEAPIGIEDYNIFIGEKASPQRVSQIWIKVNDVIVYRNVLSPRSKEIKEIANKGVGITREHLYRYSEHEKRFEGKDMVGNGM